MPWVIAVLALLVRAADCSVRSLSFDPFRRLALTERRGTGQVSAVKIAEYPGGWRGWVWGAAGLVALLGVQAGLAAEAAPISVRIGLMAEGLQLAWNSRPGYHYNVETSSEASLAAWQTASPDLPGTGADVTFSAGRPTGARRYFRIAERPTTNTGGISPNAVPPDDGIVYPGSTILGASILGWQFTIPTAWKGGLRQGTVSFLFGSDTEPGLVLGFFTLSGDVQRAAQQLAGDFETGNFSGYFQSEPVRFEGERITGEWVGYGEEQGAVLRVEAMGHPTGGIVAFGGLFIEQNRAAMMSTLKQFMDSLVLAPRPTDENFVNLLTGRAFTWSSASSAGNGGASGSLSRWSQNNAYFCQGTYEVSRFSESSFSGNLSGGAFYTGGSSSQSTETGDWTVLTTPQGPALIMMSSQGVQAALVQVGQNGNSILFGDQVFDVAGFARCQ